MCKVLSGCVLLTWARLCHGPHSLRDKGQGKVFPPGLSVNAHHSALPLGVYGLKTAPYRSAPTEPAFLLMLTSPPCLTLHNKRAEFPGCCSSIREPAHHFCVSMCVCLFFIHPPPQSGRSLELCWTQPLQACTTIYSL